MIDQDAIRESFTGLGLFGDDKTGIIRKFNVILKADSANYLLGREFDLIEAMSVSEESHRLSEKILIDAAQWCAFATFGGIMDSDEWKEIIEPNVENVQDRFSGLVAVTNCLGWGKITDWKLSEEDKTLEFTVSHSYYIDAYKKRYGKNSESPICYMWTGISGGYLDLLFGNKPHIYTGTEIACAAVSGDLCKFSAKQTKSKFGFDI